MNERHPKKELIHEIKNKFKLARDDADLLRSIENIYEKNAPNFYQNRFDRNGESYLEAMGGMEFLFNHIRKQSSPRLLYAGTGSGKAAIEFTKTLGKGIDTYGIGLNVNMATIPPEFKSHFFNSNFENFRSITSGSLTGIISNHGVFEYSPHPDLVAHRAHRLLAPNGVLKVASTVDNQIISDDERREKIALFQFYFNYFKKIGYAVATLGLEKIQVDHNNATALFLAIKPGAGVSYADQDVENLLWADSLQIEEQQSKHRAMLDLTYESAET